MNEEVPVGRWSVNGKGTLPGNIIRVGDTALGQVEGKVSVEGSTVC